MEEENALRREDRWHVAEFRGRIEECWMGGCWLAVSDGLSVRMAIALLASRGGRS